MAVNKSTAKPSDGVSGSELEGGRASGTLLAANDVHAGGANEPLGAGTQKAPESADDDGGGTSVACDGLEVTGVACVPPLEMEEAFSLWVLTDAVEQAVARLRQRIASNLPNENEVTLDKKLAQLGRWLAFIEQCRNGALADTKSPGDWSELEFAGEAMVDVARRRHEKLIGWGKLFGEKMVVLGNADLAPVGVLPERPKSRKVQEIDAVLECLAKNGYEPLSLPVVSGKQRGPKAKVWGEIGRMFTSKSAFEARWKQMKRDGHIADLKTDG